MNFTRQICILFIVCLISGCAIVLKSQTRFVYIKDYGLNDAETDMERYMLLKKAHTDAVTKGFNISYKGIIKLNIEIPKNAESIPLTYYTDFAGVTINVKNNNKDIPLFIKASLSESTIDLEKYNIDNRDFTNISALNKGVIMLSIKDDSLWVDKRTGYSYGHTRKDILLIKNGRAINSVVMPYDNVQSKPRCTYHKINKKPIIIKNLTLNRVSESKAKTFFVEITGSNNVLLENIVINTIPNDSIIGDKIIKLSDCTNVKLRKIHINGTYSTKDKYGYGISMDNIWNFEADGLYANGNWGVFGTKNVNTVLIKNSDINRFDIHCYGKDVTFKNSVFRDWYNQFSSVYGNISYNKCHFIDFTPYHTDYTYNAYVPFNLSFDDCIWEVTSKRHYLIYIGYANDEINTRQELSHKCWPNVNIHDMEFKMSECVQSIMLFHVKGKVSPNCSISYISDIKISDLKITDMPTNCEIKRFILSDAKVKIVSKVAITANKANSVIDVIDKECCFSIKNPDTKNR